MENVEDVKVEETGVVETQTTEKNEGADLQAEAQKIADAIVAKKLKDMPSKEEVKAYKEWKEAQKTAEEQQAEKELRFKQLEAEQTNLRNENTILKKGVKEKDADYVLFKVSKLDGEFEENLEKFLKENPSFLETKEEAKNTGVKTTGATIVKETGVQAILKQRHPELFN